MTMNHKPLKAVGIDLGTTYSWVGACGVWQGIMSRSSQMTEATEQLLHMSLSQTLDVLSEKTQRIKPLQIVRRPFSLVFFTLPIEKSLYSHIWCKANNWS